MESERNLMNTTEAARYLGVKPSYLYKMMMRRAVPYYKPGGKLCFFAKEDLDTWLKRVRVKAQTILDFLRQCTPYEADSIRVMVGHATGKGDTDTIEATDLLAVNRFLNHGLTKENATGSEAVMKHRQERAQKLMEAVKGFVDIGQLCRISVALMKISSDFKAVEDARQHLQSQPSNAAGRN